MRYPNPVRYPIPNKTVSYIFRLTPQEKERLSVLAHAQGVTMSDYIRQRCLMGNEATEEAQSSLDGQDNKDC